LRNAIKNMSIGDVRPREEDEDEDGPSISIRVNPLFLKEFIMFFRWIKSWVILVRVSKLDLALLHFVNIILLYFLLNLTV